MGQTKPDQAPIRPSAAAASAQYQRRRQKATDAFIVARWLPTLPYLEEWEPYDLAQLTSGAVVVEQPSEREREREATITRPPRRRRPSLLRCFSHSPTPAPVLAPAGPAEPVLPSDLPPSYDSLSRQSSRESNSLSLQRTRLELHDEHRIATWLSASTVIEDGLTAAEATSSDSRPRRVHRAPSAASADSGYASLYPAHSRTETTARESGSSPDRAGSAPQAEHEAKRRFWSFCKKKDGTGGFYSHTRRPI